MALEARDERLTRHRWLLAGLAIGLCALAFQAVGTAALSMRRDGDILYVSAPGLHFLTGKPLERLKDGAPVVFLSQLTISDASRGVLRRLPDRFVLSYDLWEEKFSVKRLGGLQRAVSGLTLAGAEAWCLDSLAISTSGIPLDKDVSVRLELRAVDPRDQAGVVGESGISLTRLIETFSRPARTAQPHWTLDSPPFRLVDVKKVEIRGSRSG